MTDLKIYYFDSSFYAAVFANETALFFDYPLDCPKEFAEEFTEERLKSFKRKLFFISHSHTDHFSEQVFSYSDENTYYIADECIKKSAPGNITNLYFVKPGDKLNIKDINISVFGSTDEGSSFGVELYNKKLFHAGDLNLWHWTGENTPEEEAEAREFFRNELGKVKKAFFKPDYAFFPVDSRMKGNYAEGAEVFIKEIEPKVFFTMHFWHDWQSVKAFEERYAENTKTLVISPQNYGKICEFDLN